jgi:hypothetical protein
MLFRLDSLLYIYLISDFGLHAMLHMWLLYVATVCCWLGSFSLYSTYIYLHKLGNVLCIYAMVYVVNLRGAVRGRAASTARQGKKMEQRS